MKGFCSVLILAAIAALSAATAKADAVVTDGQGNACIFGMRANDVIRVECTTGGVEEFIRECKLVPGTDGCSGTFVDIVWRAFITLKGQDEAVVMINGGAQRLFL